MAKSDPYKDRLEALAKQSKGANIKEIFEGAFQEARKDMANQKFSGLFDEVLGNMSGQEKGFYLPEVKIWTDPENMAEIQPCVDAKVLSLIFDAIQTSQKRKIGIKLYEDEDNLVGLSIHHDDHTYVTSKHLNKNAFLEADDDDDYGYGSWTLFKDRDVDYNGMFEFYEYIMANNYLEPLLVELNKIIVEEI